MSNQRVRIGDLRLDAVDLPAALRRISRLVAARRGGCVFTPNVDHVMRARQSRAYRAAYGRASLSLADGMPVVWASALLGRPLPAKVSGSRLLPSLVDLAVARGWRLYLLGGRPGAADRLGASLARRGAAAALVGHSRPTRLLQPLGPTSLASVEADIRRLRVDLVLVSLTAPHQELWAAAARRRLSPAVLVCTGSAIDQLVALVPRAPPSLSALGLEWAWRLAHEPRRLWRRYLLANPPFVGLVWRQWRQTRHLSGRRRGPRG